MWMYIHCLKCMSALLHTVFVSLSVHLINIMKSSNHQELLICTLTANTRCWSMEIGFQSMWQGKWSSTHWCHSFVRCTSHIDRLLANNWFVLLCALCEIFKISYHLHLISSSVSTYFVIIKIRANYLPKHDFTATEMAEPSWLKHFILSHDTAQSKHIWRHIINFLSSKNKHLETGPEHTLLVLHCGNLSHPSCLHQPQFSSYSKHRTKKLVYYVVTQIQCWQ